jgi:hypothetical protein
MKADLQHAAGWVLAWAAREALRYPLYAIIIGLLAVIAVIRRGRGTSPSGETPTVIVRNGAGLLGVAAIAAIAGVAYYVTRSHATPKAAPAPTPVITQKVVHPTIVQHITHVTAAHASGIQGWQIVAVLGIVFAAYVIVQLNKKPWSD